MLVSGTSINLVSLFLDGLQARSPRSHWNQYQATVGRGLPDASQMNWYGFPSLKRGGFVLDAWGIVVMTGCGGTEEKMTYTDGHEE